MQAVFVDARAGVERILKSYADVHELKAGVLDLEGVEAVELELGRAVRVDDEAAVALSEDLAVDGAVVEVDILEELVALELDGVAREDGGPGEDIGSDEQQEGCREK